MGDNKLTTTIKIIMFVIKPILIMQAAVTDKSGNKSPSTEFPVNI
jgi:hypothetical protein